MATATIVYPFHHVPKGTKWALLLSLTLHSASTGLMKGEPRMVCVLIMWSSRSTWISSTADTMLVSCNRILSADLTQFEAFQTVLKVYQFVIRCLCIEWRRNGAQPIHSSFFQWIFPVSTLYWPPLQSLPTWGKGRKQTTTTKTHSLLYDHRNYYHNIKTYAWHKTWSIFPTNWFSSKYSMFILLFVYIPTSWAYSSENLESPISNMSRSELFTSGLTSKPTMLLICTQINYSHQLNGSVVM